MCWARNKAQWEHLLTDVHISKLHNPTVCFIIIEGKDNQNIFTLRALNAEFSPHLLPQDVRIDKQLQSGLRVTVQLDQTQNQGNSVRQVGTLLLFCAFSLWKGSAGHFIVCAQSENKLHKGVVVAPHVPRTEGGLYWGYSVRLASCLSTCPVLTLTHPCLQTYSHHLRELRAATNLFKTPSSAPQQLLCPDPRLLMQVQFSQRVRMERDTMWLSAHQSEAATWTRPRCRHSSRVFNNLFIFRRG